MDNAQLSSKQVTYTDTKRYARFRSPLDLHAFNSEILVTKLAAGFETLSSLLTGESATRTLSSLHNLIAVRGLKDSDGNLALSTSMSGPHHYLGWLNPYKQHTITGWSDGLPIYCECECELATTGKPVYSHQLHQIPDWFITKIPCEKFAWLSGVGLNTEQKKRYNLKYVTGADSKFGTSNLFNTDTGARSNDSLFSNPGILELDTAALNMQVLRDPWNYDLSEFKAHVVPNNNPWGFDQEAINTNIHAQHRLRVITYNYGPEYVDKYLFHPKTGTGQFIERHEFIQAITPCTDSCNGYVLLGREVRKWALGPVIQLDLIAIAVPYGYTLLVEPWAIHGDSALTGMYSMAMTGNHIAMQTADTVFIRNVHNGKPVKILTDFNTANPDSGQSHKLLITSDMLTNTELTTELDILKNKISDSLSYFQKLYWQPEILTFDKITDCIDNIKNPC